MPALFFLSLTITQFLRQKVTQIAKLRSTFELICKLSIRQSSALVWVSPLPTHKSWQRIRPQQVRSGVVLRSGRLVIRLWPRLVQCCRCCGHSTSGSHSHRVSGAQFAYWSNAIWSSFVVFDSEFIKRFLKNRFVVLQNKYISIYNGNTFWLNKLSKCLFVK